MLKRLLIPCVLCLTAMSAKAQSTAAPLVPEPPKQWAHESEVALVTSTGNSENESASAKQKTAYSFDNNIVTNSARYLQSKTSGTETSRNWDVSLRYERTLSELWGTFIAHLIESDPYSGFIQRNSTDLGAKYTIVKNDVRTWLAEAGGRYAETYTVTGEHDYANLGRVYSEYSQALNETVSFKIWAEYLPNFNESEAYLANGEASMTSILSKVFSLKLSYLAKYQNLPAVAGAKTTDTVFTTSLVAKF
ncbi:MAG: DUF481 domain-containing protein [Bdellovibrionaceae bacterium]|nr:DUF481 domain-containing protein [Pseudobdellovibrionaceae bacterium]